MLVEASVSEMLKRNGWLCSTGEKTLEPIKSFRSCYKITITAIVNLLSAAVAATGARGGGGSGTTVSITNTRDLNLIFLLRSAIPCCLEEGGSQT